MDLQEEATIDLIQSMQFYIEENQHRFENNKELLFYLYKLCEQIVDNKNDWKKFKVRGS